MSQTLMHLADQPAGIETPAQRPPRNTVPASFKVAGTTVAVRNPWQDADGNLVATKNEVPPAPIDPITEEPVFTDSPEAFRLMAHWKKLKASYEADPAPWIFNEITVLAEQIKALHPEILDIEPMPKQILPVEVVDATDKLTPPPESAGAIVPAATVLNSSPKPSMLTLDSTSMDEGEFKTFEVNGHKVRGMKIDGLAAVVAHEFAEAMGYAKPRNAVARHCKGALKRGILTQGVVQEVVMIFAPDVYRLIVKSKLPSSQEFERMVFEEILPAIQETGVYVAKGAQLPTAPGTNLVEAAMVEVLVKMKDGMDATIARLGDHSSQISSLGDRVTIVDERILRIEAENNTLKLNLAEIETEFIRRGGRLRERPVEAEPEGGSPGIRSNEEYLAVDAFRLRYYPNGFVTSGLTMDNHRFGIRASQLCRQRGIKVEYWFCGNGNARCYPLSILRDVAESFRWAEVGLPQGKKNSFPFGGCRVWTSPWRRELSTPWPDRVQGPRSTHICVGGPWTEPVRPPGRRE